MHCVDKAFTDGIPVYCVKGAATVAESVDVVPTFTGTGFARLYNAGDRVVWWVSIPPRTINYTIIIRYKVSIILS